MSDHIGEPDAMICPHCGLPADRNQNGIQGYRCGSSFCKTFNVQWARSMTCLELENKKLKGDLDLAYFGENALIQKIRNLENHANENNQGIINRIAELKIENLNLQDRIELLEAANSDVARIADERDRAHEHIKHLEEIGDEMRAWCNDKKSCEQWDKSRRPNHE